MTLPIVGMFLLIGTILNNYGCKKEDDVVNTTSPTGIAPVAAFIAMDTLITLGDTIQFNDSSSNKPTSWFWDFGNGDTSILQNPLYVYPAAGIYTVSLAVSNSFGSDADTMENYITVNALPVAAFTANKTSITEGESIQFTDRIQFTDQSTNDPTSWSWNFGDGSTSTLQNPSYTYNTTGSYTVSLTATSATDSYTETKTDYITVSTGGGGGTNAPVAAFTANKTSITEGESIQFTDQSTNTPTSWSWDFGDSTSTQQNPSHTYNTAGSYTVSLTATNAIGSGTETKTGYITVSAGGAVTGIVVDIDSNVYNTVEIGTQWWMAEDLAATYFDNGTPIALETDDSTWANLTTSGYCWYNNDEGTYKDPYGALYNWYAVAAGNLCPTGWHVPTDAEWTTLTDYLGGESVAGGAMKETGTTYWATPNTSATNSSGFTALPAGFRDTDGTFLNLGSVVYFWSATQDNTTDAWTRTQHYNNGTVGRSSGSKTFGFSVRCVKD